MKAINTKVDDELYEALATLANKQERTVAAQLRFMLAQWHERHKKGGNGELVRAEDWPGR